MPFFRLILLIFVLTCFGANLTLTENAGIPRTAEPVTFGIPIKQGELPNHPIGSDPSFSIAGIPAQYKVLSKWHDNSARWILATFITDFSAGETRVLGFGRGSGSALASSLTVSENSDTLVINTGVINVEILKGAKFNVINRVWRNSSLVVDNTGLRGMVLKSYIDNGDADEYVGRALPDSVIVEENGPIRACVYIVGRFYNGAKMLKATGDPICGQDINTRFMVRIWAYNNKDEVKISTTLHNTGGNGIQGVYPGDGYQRPVTFTFDANGARKEVTTLFCENVAHPLFFSSLYYDLKMNLGSSRTVVSAGNTSENVTSSDNISFLQATPDACYIFKNGSQIYTGGRGLGYVNISDGSLGMGAALKYSWEAYPKRLDVLKDTLRINLFPQDIAPGSTYFKVDTDSYYSRHTDKFTKCYLVPPGVWLRNEVNISFHAGSFNTANFAKARKYPVMPKFDDNYLHGTKAVDGFHSDTMIGLEPKGSLIQRLFERKRVWSGIMYDYDMTEPSDVGKPRQSLWEYWDEPHQYNPDNKISWGNLNMGDIWYGEIYSNLHYDLNDGVLHSFLRTGHYKAWTVSEMLANHRTDVVTYHHKNGHVWCDGSSRYEKDDHLIGWVSPRPSHCWSEGLGLYYVLTGDPFVREAFEESVDNSFWTWVRWLGGDMTGTGSNTTELRMMGWPLLNVCHGYDILGNEAYYEWCKKLFHQVCIPTEQTMGPGYSSSWTQMQGYLVTPLIKFFHMLKPEDQGTRDSVAQLLLRIWELSESMRTLDGGASGSVFNHPKYNNIGMDIIGLVDINAFAWRYLNKPQARDQGIVNALSLIGYHQRRDGVALDEYSRAHFKSNRYAYSETKMHGKIGIFGRSILEYEYDSLVPIQQGDGALGNESQADLSSDTPFEITSASPNPFNPATLFRLHVPYKLAGKPVSLVICNSVGKVVFKQEINAKMAGLVTVSWQGRDNYGKPLSSGVYIAQFRTGLKRTKPFKSILVK